MKQLIIFCCFICLWQGASAQKLTLEKCRQMALENNKNIKIASLSSLAAEDNLKAYKANRYVKLSATGNYLYSNGTTKLTMPGGYLPTFVPNLTTGGLDPNILTTLPDGTTIFKEYAYMPETNFDIKFGSIYSFGALAEQPIYMGGKIRSAVRMAKGGVDVARLNEQKSAAEVIEKSDEAFWTYIQVGEALKSAEKYRDVVVEFLRQIENAHNIGLKTKNDLLKVQVRLNEARLMVRQAENGVVLARMNLCHYIGLSLTTTDIEVDGNFADNSLNISSSQLNISARPEYKMLVRQTEIRKEGVRLAKSDFLPQVAAMASYNYMNGIKFNNEKLFNDAAFSGGVTVSVPLFHWGEGRRKVSAARREAEIAKYQLAEMSEMMQLELMQSLNRYDEAVLEVALTQRSVEQAEENMTLSKNQYDAGMETLADYLESQALWQKAMSDNINAKAKQRLAYTQYLKAVGELK